MGVVYMGLDIGSSTCHAVGQDKEGTIVLDRRTSTGERGLIDLVKSVRGKIRINMESSELCKWVRRVLLPHVDEIHVSNARRNAWIAKDPHKGDQVDAGKLATLLRMGNVHEVYCTDDDHRSDFKEIVQTYEQLTHREACLKQQIKARMRCHGVICKSGAIYSEAGRKTWEKNIQSSLAREMIRQLDEQLDGLLKRREEMKRLMRRTARRYPEIKRFQEVPGIGIIGACKFSAYVQTPDRFSNKRKLWGYCRLGIVDRRSDGKPLGKKRLDHNGVGTLKDMSNKAFHGAMKTKNDNMFKRFYTQSLTTTHNETHARLSTQRKILAVLLAMWKGGSVYRDDHRG